jgi:hypothetical protein
MFTQQMMLPAPRRLLAGWALLALAGTPTQAQNINTAALSVGARSTIHIGGVFICRGHEAG